MDKGVALVISLSSFPSSHPAILPPLLRVVRETEHSGTSVIKKSRG
jgi:hypothetical protein